MKIAVYNYREFDETWVKDINDKVFTTLLC